MAKTTANPPAAASRRWTVAAAVVALVLMVAGGIYYAMRTREAAEPLDAASSASQASPDDVLSRKVVLPAIPRRPRPAALSPEQFKDPQVRKSYEIARENPALLEQMPCYCGCYQNPGHTNNLDCFVDKHGET